MYYVDTLKRELIDTNAYNLQASFCEKVVVDGHGCHTVLHFGVKAKITRQGSCCICYLNSIQNL